MSAWGHKRKKTAHPRHFCYAVQTGRNQLESGHGRSNVGSRGQSGRATNMAGCSGVSHKRTLTTFLKIRSAHRAECFRVNLFDGDILAFKVGLYICHKARRSA